MPGVEPRSAAEPRHMGRALYPPNGAPDLYLFKATSTENTRLGGGILLSFSLLLCVSGMLHNTVH